MNARAAVLLGALALSLAPAIAVAADPLTPAGLAAELAFDGACLLDYRQSTDIANHAGMYETNQILGDHPSGARLRAYFVGAIALHFAITRMLSGSARNVWQGASLVIELGQVQRNASLGLRVRF